MKIYTVDVQYKSKVNAYVRFENVKDEFAKNRMICIVMKYNDRWR